jgi:hypothetical protein
VPARIFPRRLTSVLGSAGDETLDPHVHLPDRLEVQRAVFQKPLRLFLRQLLPDFAGFGGSVLLLLPAALTQHILC